MDGIVVYPRRVAKSSPRGVANQLALMLLSGVGVAIAYGCGTLWGQLASRLDGLRGGYLYISG